MNRKFKHLVCFLLYVTGITPILWRLLLRGKKKALILLYHRIAAPETTFDPWVPPAQFEKQLQFLSRHFEVCTIQELMERMDQNKTGSKPYAAITFDDGYKDNFKAAYPLLKKYNLPAMFFLATGSIGTEEPIWTERVDQMFKKTRVRNLTLETLDRSKCFDLGKDKYDRMKVSYEIKNEMKQMPDPKRQVTFQELEAKMGFSGEETTDSGMLSWEDVRKMAADPLMEMGSHTVSHRMLACLEKEEIRFEFEASKQKIEEETGKPVRFVSYPGNSYNQAVEREASQSGYAAGFAVDHALCRFSKDRFALTRIHVEEGPFYAFLAEITQALGFLRSLINRQGPRKREGV